ncbi:4307_t:CDS:1, partial [Funneliformis mosseae]
VANYSSIGTVMTLEFNEEELVNNFIIDDSNITSSRDTLVLEDIINLTLPIFDINDKELHSKEKDQNNIILPSNLKYNPKDLVNSFLQENLN